MRLDVHVLEEIRVVAVEHRAIVDRTRQIGRDAAARGEHEVDPLDAPTIVKADVVVDDEVMALARHYHVVVAVEPQFARPACLDRHHGCDASNRCRLTFLAAERTTHAPATADDVFRCPVGRMRHEPLNFVRVLRRAEDAQDAILLGNDHRDMPLEIELILAAQGQAALQPMWRFSDRFLGIAASDLFGRQYEALLFDGCQWIEYGLEFLIVDFRQPRSLARLIDRLRRDREYRLAGELDDFGSENRLVRDYRPAIVQSRNVVGTADVDDAGRRQHGA